MKLRLALFVSLLVCSAALIVPAGAGAATYHRYTQGGATSKFTLGAWFNSTHRKLVTFNFAGTCDDGSLANSSATNLKVSSGGSFSGEIKFNIYLKSTQTQYPATATFTGKVKKRKYVKVTNTVTTEAPGCAVLTHNYKAKYRGVQHGG